MHYPVNLLNLLTVKVIGGILGQVREAIGFKRPKEDLFEEFDIDSSVAFMKTKKGFRTFSIQERDPRAVPFLRIGAGFGAIVAVIMAAIRSGFVYPMLASGVYPFFFKLGQTVREFYNL